MRTLLKDDLKRLETHPEKNQITSVVCSAFKYKREELKHQDNHFYQADNMYVEDPHVQFVCEEKVRHK